MPRHIFADEVVYDGRLEALSLVGNDVPNAQAMTQIASIVEILGAIVFLVETKGHTHYLISGILQKHSSYGTVRTATHPQQNSLFRIHSTNIRISEREISSSLEYFSRRAKVYWGFNSKQTSLILLFLTSNQY